MESLKEQVRKIKDLKFENIVEEIKKLKPTYENTIDNNKTWYDKFNHITDLEFEVIEVYQTLSVLEKIKVLDEKLARQLGEEKNYIFTSKKNIEICWARQYEKDFGTDAFLSNWGAEIIKKTWDEKFCQCIIHLALVCQYHKKYREIKEGKIVTIPSYYPHEWLLAWEKRLYDITTDQNNRSRRRERV